MIYLKNDNTLFQEIWIPRQNDEDYSPVNPYDKGYADGEAAQKAKLVATAVTENGITIRREDGYSAVTVDVQEQGITKEMDMTGDTLTIGRTTRPTVWEKTVYGGNLTDFEALIDEYPIIRLNAYDNPEHSDWTNIGQFQKTGEEYGWYDIQANVWHPFSGISQTWEAVGQIWSHYLYMLCDGANVFFYHNFENGIFVDNGTLTLDDLIFDVAQTHMMSAVTVDATLYADLKYSLGYNDAFGIVKRDAIDLTFTENGTWEADPDFFNHIFAKKVVVNVPNHKDFFTFVNRTASAGTVSFIKYGTAERTFKWKISNDGTNWTTREFSDTTTFPLPANGYLYIDGRENTTFPQMWTFDCDVDFDVKGDLSTLVADGTPLVSYAFSRLFIGIAETHLISAKDLRLDYENLTAFCFEKMFSGQNKLTTPPLYLPALNLARECYYMMFQGCTHMTVAPSLPATTVPQNGYEMMFHDCWVLTDTPALPATTIGFGAYSNMFSGCHSLLSAPVLPSTLISETYNGECYFRMFDGCSSLLTFVCYATDLGLNNGKVEQILNRVQNATIYCPASMVSTWRGLYPNLTVRAIQ